MAAGDIIFEDGTIITPADLEKLIPLITNALGATAKDPSEYPVLERLDDLTSLPVFDAGYNLGRVSILRLKGVNGKNAILRVQGDMLQWSLEGTDIWNDLYSKSDLKGDPGAAANMEIGEVASGDTPAATITGEAPNYKLNLVLVPGGKGDTGDDGKTPVLASVSAQSGETASGSFTDDGVDELGNPKYILDLTLPKGQDGQPAIFEQGTTTTLNPSEEARVEVIENGLTPEGNPKYLLNFFIPRGQMGPAGTGTGNVLVDATGLVSGKKYLFVPDSDGSTAGTFVEYTPPGNATAESAGLMTSDQFQKLEKLSPDEYVKKDGSTPFTGYIDMKATETFVRFFDPISGIERGSFGGDKDKVFLFNGARGKSLNYSNDGKLLFEDKETFAVDADNELTLAGKKLSELGGSQKGLDITSIFLSLMENPTELIPVSQEMFDLVVNAYNERMQMAYIEMEGLNQYFLMNIDYNTANDEYFYRINLLSPQSMGGMNGYCDYNVISPTIYVDRKVCEFNNSNIRLYSNGIGNKFLSDDGDYKTIPSPSIPTASSLVLGGIKTGYTQSNKNYPVLLDTDSKAYVNVPWTDTNTTYPEATTLTAGLMSATDKTKLDRIGSYTTATTVANLNANYENIEISNLSANASLSVNLVGTTYNGWDINVFIYCSSARTITIPTSGNYISMIGSSLSCPAGKWTELNLHCSGGKWRIAKLEQE